MVRLRFGWVVLAAALIPQIAAAEPEQADIWIGINGTRDGFLLNTETGELWMTGQCLKRLEPATASQSGWTSRTTELVSIGRGQALLDQTFHLETDAGSPSIVIVNPDRGGEQSVENAVRLDCADSPGCDALLDSPRC